MNRFPANEAETQFGDMLLKAPRTQVQINRRSLVSAGDSQSTKAMKLQLLQARAAQARADIAAGDIIDGDIFFDELGVGRIKED